MSFDFDLEPEFVKLYERCRTKTMTSIERMHALYKAVEYVVRARIAGDFAECGVWRGGSVMLMALAAQQFGDSGRRIWIYDTFNGMTEPSPLDKQAMTGRSARDILSENAKSLENPFWGIASQDTVTDNLQRTGYPMERFVFVKGDILETLPATAPDKLAILRLDTDWYQSTRHELRALYPRLLPGGVLILDDYGYWTGAKRAADEFFADEEKVPFLHRIDFTGRIGLKP